jgi:polysaccharide biosynthesis protein PslH
MKILMVASYLPFPLFSGGHVRLFNLIKELSEKHDVTLICEKRPYQNEEDIKQVEKICNKVITVNRKKQWSVENIIVSIFSPNSFLVTGHSHGEMRSRISTELANKQYDLIHVETYYVFQNVPSVSLPIVLTEHNIEFMVYKRFVDTLSVLLRPMFGIEINKIKNEEEAFWQKATRLVAVSKSDAKIMEEKGLKPAIVPNGVDTDKFSLKQRVVSRDSQAKKILFIGDFKWIQNLDAAKFIIEEIWPLINKEQRTKYSEQEVKLWIVGRKIPESIRSLSNDPNIFFDEESAIRPTEELFQEANLLLAPIRVGGGTSYKILESMSCGTPAVTMLMSADAIEAEDNNNIMVGENAQELADKAIQLLTDPKLYEKVSHNGRRLIEEKYTWKKIGKDLEKVYRDAENNK